MSQDVVFIHGMFMNPKSWAGWIELFSSKGFRTHAPAWPGHEGEPAMLREVPPDLLYKLSLGDVIEAHRAFFKTLPGKPILIGHSVGGLVAQRLLNEGLALAAVAIDPAPPKGIISVKWSFLKANLPVINPLAGDRPFQFTLERFHYAFCNTITIEETRPIFEAFVVPESRNVARGPTGPDGAIDFSKSHAPLLIIGGESDHIVPWAAEREELQSLSGRREHTGLQGVPGPRPLPLRAKRVGRDRRVHPRLGAAKSPAVARSLTAPMRKFEYLRPRFHLERDILSRSSAPPEQIPRL